MGKVASAPIQSIRHSYSATSVTTSAYVELDSALNGDGTEIEIFDSGGQTMVLAQGAASGEQDMFYIVPGGNGRMPFQASKGMRLSVKAISANATSGELVINIWG